MIGKWLNYMSRLHDGVDAILIADRHGIIEYSAMFSEQENGLIDEGFIGKNILEVYPELTKETSSHFRVMRTGEPILNEKQVLTDFRGRRVMLVTSTFPLEDNGTVIGTMETSVFYHKDSQLDGKNHWLTNPHTGLFRLEDIITRNSEMLALKDTVQRVAANPSPVLIWGETGTGKELFDPAGEHTVRHHPGELYRRGKPEGPAQAGRRWHPLSGRGQLHGSLPPGQDIEGH